MKEPFNIDIARHIGPDLKSRIVVRDLDLYIRNLGVEMVNVDFGNVQFATRSFIDEFYNVFLKKDTNPVNVQAINVPADLQVVFKAVETTQQRPKTSDFHASVVYLNTISEAKKFFSLLVL